MATPTPQPVQQVVLAKDLQFNGSDDTAQKLRRLMEAFIKTQNALNQLISQGVVSTVVVEVTPHVIATTAGLGPDHTTSGLTPGMVLKATAATKAAFAFLAFNDLEQTDISDSPAEGDVIEFHDGYWSNVQPPDPGEVNDGVNLGSGADIYAGKNGPHLKFRSIIGAGGVLITQEDNDLIIDGGGAGGAGGYPAELGYAGIL